MPDLHSSHISASGGLFSAAFIEAIREADARLPGGEGFLPGYAFPPQATALAFDDQEDELARSPLIALNEYAPGNFVYYRGARYEITHARPRSRRAGEGVAGGVGRPETELDMEPMLICPACERAYVGRDEATRARCVCGADLSTVHPRQAMALVDMYAQHRARITADEEERMRRGYVLTTHYRAGGKAQAYAVTSAGPAFRMTLEHDGEVLQVNQGAREEAEDRAQGFTLCRKCHAWLTSENAVSDHVYTTQKQGKCPRRGTAADLVFGLWLTTAIRSDLALLDVPLPEEAADQSEAFYVTLANTFLRALLVAFNLDEQELGSFLAPSPEEGVPFRVVLYEMAVGGSGVLASLAEPERLAAVVARARELLHEGDPEGGCEKACYACLLSFFNQRHHDLLDRMLVLPWLQALGDLDVTPIVSEDRFEALSARCESQLERQVLSAIRGRGLPLPTAAQQTILDDDAPLAIADFTYDPRIVIFVDGSPHHRDYVQTADARKRLRLRALDYRVVVITAEQPDAGLDELAACLGGVS